MVALTGDQKRLFGFSRARHRRLSLAQQYLGWCDPLVQPRLLRTAFWTTLRDWTAHVARGSVAYLRMLNRIAAIQAAAEIRTRAVCFPRPTVLPS